VICNCGYFFQDLTSRKGSNVQYISGARISEGVTSSRETNLEVKPPDEKELFENVEGTLCGEPTPAADGFPASSEFCRLLRLLCDLGKGVRGWGLGGWGVGLRVAGLGF